ncbi:riboflavin synthase subunit alpha [Capsaspora owczarzaki ATCC 30864]|uniref:Riboflavin synthase subunit alpha n=1 Tax=Capsaspora owczarzaki (strain ATCC 30864) TaxID=595528 RepID=A0A0D2UT70_CAPO3|nr:riboflavin synthase subunit alpha [Capsaspora owczarzaki ATCC 30864]KJE98156.1 riboflavin synthase subunit alpha [Capsaspora owczarzaki ATCC 30864]|eukprot:XP_004342766.1 riboflavin synthase subunit alpha [Capsaspora owczarzaki ATCC 30864]
MFTGIVRGLCPIRSALLTGGILRLQVELPAGDASAGIELGASIAINGTCLTVVHFDAATRIVDFDVIQESLSRTNLGSLQAGSRVNMERAMKFGDEIGGHQVFGHVDATGTIERVVATEGNRDVYFRFFEEWSKFVVPKGWIAVDGISLTIVHVAPGLLSVSLIPETLARTTLGFKNEGDIVNLEFDPQAKLVVLTMERLLPGMLERQLAARA